MSQNSLVIKVYQLLADGRWFSPAFSTTKTGRHDIAEILLCLMINFKPENTYFCNFQSWERTHFVLVIGQYELLDMTLLIEPPEYLEYTKCIRHIGNSLGPKCR
jgi:hypothetical protein